MKKLAFIAIIAALSIPAIAHNGRPGGGHSGGGYSSGHSAGHSTGAGTHSSKAATGTGAKSAHEHVSGYTRKSGTRVAPHDRSTADSTTRNNWSTKGNTNPETGKPGTK